MGLSARDNNQVSTTLKHTSSYSCRDCSRCCCYKPFFKCHYYNHFEKLCGDFENGCKDYYDSINRREFCVELNMDQARASSPPYRTEFGVDELPPSYESATRPSKPLVKRTLNGLIDWQELPRIVQCSVIILVVIVVVGMGFFLIGVPIILSNETARERDRAYEAYYAQLKVAGRNGGLKSPYTNAAVATGTAASASAAAPVIRVFKGNRDVGDVGISPTPVAASTGIANAMMDLGSSETPTRNEDINPSVTLSGFVIVTVPVASRDV